VFVMPFLEWVVLGLSGTWRQRMRLMRRPTRRRSAPPRVGQRCRRAGSASRYPSSAGSRAAGVAAAPGMEAAAAALAKPALEGV